MILNKKPLSNASRLAAAIVNVRNFCGYCFCRYCMNLAACWICGTRSPGQDVKPQPKSLRPKSKSHASTRFTRTWGGSMRAEHPRRKTDKWTAQIIQNEIATSYILSRDGVPIEWDRIMNKVIRGFLNQSHCRWASDARNLPATSSLSICSYPPVLELAKRQPSYTRFLRFINDEQHIWLVHHNINFKTEAQEEQHRRSNSCYSRLVL